MIVGLTFLILLRGTLLKYFSKKRERERELIVECSYAGGQSEIMMGRAIKKYGWKRNDVVITTKVRCNPIVEQSHQSFRSVRYLLRPSTL